VRISAAKSFVWYEPAESVVPVICAGLLSEHPERLRAR
jgi:hypothetical protein